MKPNVNRVITSIVAFGLLLPMASFAREDGSSTPVQVGSWVKAVDEKGDRNSIGEFNRSESNKRLAKVNGTVTAVSATSISVKKDGGTTIYTFIVDSNTKIIRKFKGHAGIAEVAVGDKVRVWATSLTSGTAKLIWDKSIWWVALTGTISELNSTDQTFKLTITRKESETGLTMTLTIPIKTSVATTYWLGTTPKEFSDLANGQKVKIRGSFNRVGQYVWAGKITIQS